MMAPPASMPIAGNLVDLTISRAPPLSSETDQRDVAPLSSATSSSVDGACDPPRMLLVSLVKQRAGSFFPHDRCARQDRRHVALCHKQLRHADLDRIDDRNGRDG